jgi:hypothetical protein
MTMPNFLVLGAAKAGTTSLYQYLKQHPQIFMSPTKEPNFFAYEGQTLDFQGWGRLRGIEGSITELPSYRAQFATVSNQVAVGEASTIYLYDPTTAARIRHYIPEAKLIAILRHPVDRAYSQFLQFIREGREPLVEFAQALQAEETRRRNNWTWSYQYTHVGLYYAQLKRYFDTFQPGQIKIYLFDDLKTNLLKTLGSIFDFLEVDESFVPDTKIRYNISGVPINKTLHALLNGSRSLKTVLKPLLPQKLRRWLLAQWILVRSQNLVKPELPSQTRQELLEVFRPDILKLQHLIQRDLSTWLA